MLLKVGPNVAEPLVSIVVPVYNGAHYLTRFQEMVGRLVEPSVELIFVDDGSTDGSGSLLEDWSSQRTGTRVLRQDNRGQGPARNAGFLAASGRYTLFADIDDFLHPEIVSQPIALAEELKSDILQVGFRDWHDTVPPPFEPTGHPSIPKKLSPGTSFFELFPAAWSKVYRTEYLHRVGVQYPGYKYEDNVEIQRLCCEGGRFYSIPQVYYFYYQNPLGTVRTPRNKLDLFSAIEGLEVLMQRHPQYRCELLTRVESLLADLEDSLLATDESWAVEKRPLVAEVKQRWAPEIADNPYYRLPLEWEQARKRTKVGLVKEKIKSWASALGLRPGDEPQDRWSCP